jgi:hypothetical protein
MNKLKVLVKECSKPWELLEEQEFGQNRLEEMEKEEICDCQQRMR